MGGAGICLQDAKMRAGGGGDRSNRGFNPAGWIGKLGLWHVDSSFPQMVFGFFVSIDAISPPSNICANALGAQEKVLENGNRIGIKITVGVAHQFDIAKSGNGDTTSIANLHEHVGLQKKLPLLKLEDSNVRLHAVKVVTSPKILTRTQTDITATSN
ncbi:hypothetical protein L2E82_12974 [Cichorium intybus]|uniref:Uncharacterized protein n=1 Tax=Cichorium intybus TaxID=13427 RepID=A0ACB9GIR3_CICIN|nr:hypothetical protein L2E82_12974 [Cichorium intybus]